MSTKETTPTTKEILLTMAHQRRDVAETGTFIGSPPRKRIVHRGAKINQRGGVSPLCAKTPRALDLSKATWVLRDEAVTCPKCLRLIAARYADAK